MKKTLSLPRHKFIIFSDIDGTLDLNAPNLKESIKEIEENDGMFIPVTGRTIGDIKNKFIENEIELPEIIVGDNGGGIYYTPTNEFLEKRKLAKEEVEYVLKECEEQQINPEYIRYTDGETIYASENPTVDSYYTKNKRVVKCSNVKKQMTEVLSATKITLVGDKTKMQKINEKIAEKGLWGHVDKTAFPKPEMNNFRIDITQEDISKGHAIKEIVEELEPENGYITIGNGYNDMSMFEQAIDDGMMAAIVNPEEIEDLYKELKEYSEEKEGEVIVVEPKEDLANTFIAEVSKGFGEKLNKKNRKRKSKNE